MARRYDHLAHRFYTLAFIMLVVTALYFGRELFIPVALAIFLTFLLAPLANRLELWGFRRVPASLMSIALAFVVILAVGGLVTDQFISLAQQLPKYEDNIRTKVQTVQEMSLSILSRARQSMEGITGGPATAPRTSPAGRVEPIPPRVQAALTEPAAAQDHRRHLPPSPDGSPAASSEQVQDMAPIPVEIVSGDHGWTSYLFSSVGALLSPLGMVVIVVVLAIFALIQRRDLRDRLISVTGMGQINVTTQAYDEVTRRISRYLLMQLVVNTCYAVPLAIGLSLFGIPGALLWGVIGLVLRFIPYVGAWTTGGIAILLSIAVFQNWWGPIGVLIFIVTLELILNNLIEPWLYSVGTGVSMMGVIFSAIFWAWLWGPVGLVLSTPILVCLTVMGRHLPQLEIFDLLFGGEVKLKPQLRLFQRVLAMDVQEAVQLADEARQSESLVQMYDRLLIPALRLVEEEKHRGQITAQREADIYETFHRVIGECAERNREERPPVAAPAGSDLMIVCLPAGDQADELVCHMLEQVLQAEGYTAETASVGYLSSEMMTEVERRGAHIVIVSALPPAAFNAARYLCKRLTRKGVDIPLLAGLWGEDIRESTVRLENCGATRVVVSLNEALREAASLAAKLAAAKGRS